MHTHTHMYTHSAECWFSRYNTVSSLSLGSVSHRFIAVSDHSEHHLDTHIQYVPLTHTHTEPSQQSSVRFGSFEAEQKCSNVTALGDRLLAPWHPYYTLLLSSSSPQPSSSSPRQPARPPTTDTTLLVLAVNTRTHTHADCHSISSSKLRLRLCVFNISMCALCL